MFDIIKDILHQKSGRFIGDNEAMGEYSVYMAQRWISMFSNQPIEFLNSTINIMYKALDDEESYKFLLTTLPKYKYKRISYIKAAEKTKKRTTKEPEDRIQIEESLEKLENSMEFVFGKGE